MALVALPEIETGNVHEYTATLAVELASSPLIGDSILLPNKLKDLTVAVHPEGATSGRIEYSASSRAAVIAGTAKWIAWGAGDVATATLDHLAGPITAFRCVATTAGALENVVLEVTGNELI